jgi:hypothetical protein
MIVISYPQPGFRLKKEAEKEFIFDTSRKKWLLLTPEEWVRQNFTCYLTRTMGYPAALIAFEKEIRLGEMKKRFDILVYNDLHQPWMMVECKAPSVKLDESVLRQVLRYNISVPVTYMIITNGPETYGWHKKDGDLTLIEALPPWK